MRPSKGLRLPGLTFGLCSNAGEIPGCGGEIVDTEVAPVILTEAARGKHCRLRAPGPENRAPVSASYFSGFDSVNAPRISPALKPVALSCG